MTCRLYPLACIDGCNSLAHKGTIMKKLIPRQPVPPLVVQTLSGKQWKMDEQDPKHFTMIVFYRGLHCPVCRSYISELNRLLDDFVRRGVEVIAISSDTRSRAQETVEKWKLENLEIGFELDFKTSSHRAAGRPPSGLKNRRDSANPEFFSYVPIKPYTGLWFKPCLLPDRTSKKS